MNNCAFCKGVVPSKFRRNARNGMAKKGAKTFYHYACAGWRLKPKMAVRDTWYGPGEVVKVTRSRVHIKLYAQDRVWKFDKAHVEAFIRKEK